MSQRIRDSIHGFIHFCSKETQIINLFEFQRLRNIKQLALTHYVYPGAMHSRFEHCLGVMKLASDFFDMINNEYNRSLIQKNLKKIGLTIEEARSILRLAGLLHDIGHLPFSHGGEEILPSKKKHEDVSIEIIGSLEEKIDSLYFSNASSLVKQLIQKDLIIPELSFLKNIISGSIDADRTDYLLRDSYHCGVTYGSFDYKRLIETLTVIENTSGILELALDYGGIHSLEALILARYYMFTQVYLHRTRRIYDIYLKSYMNSWKPNLRPLTNVLKYDDIDLISQLKRSSIDDQDVGHIWAKRICERNHHSVIYETKEFADAKDRRKTKGIFEQLKEEYEEEGYEFILDEKANGTIHKYYVEGEEEEAEEFFVVHRHKQDIITKFSTIIQKMPKKFHVMRIYVNQKNNQVLKTLKERAVELEKEVR